MRPIATHLAWSVVCLCLTRVRCVPLYAPHGEYGRTILVPQWCRLTSLTLLTYWSCFRWVHSRFPKTEPMGLIGTCIIQVIALAEACKCYTVSKLSCSVNTFMQAVLCHYPRLFYNYYTFNGLFLRTTWVSWYQKGKTSLDLNEQETIRFWDAVASAGPYVSSLHLAQNRQPHQYCIAEFLQAGCSSWCPTNSVKSLKAQCYSRLFHSSWLKYTTLTCIYNSATNFVLPGEDSDEHILRLSDSTSVDSVKLSSNGTIKLLSSWLCTSFNELLLQNGLPITFSSTLLGSTLKSKLLLLLLDNKFKCAGESGLSGGLTASTMTIAQKL